MIIFLNKFVSPRIFRYIHPGIFFQHFWIIFFIWGAINHVFNEQSCFVFALHLCVARKHGIDHIFCVCSGKTYIRCVTRPL